MTLQSEISQDSSAESFVSDDPAKILSRLTDTDLRRAERRALIHHLVDKTIERPGEAMVLEIDHIARIAQGRVIERKGEDGALKLYFATRNTQGDTPRLDDIYQLTRQPDGSTTFQIDFMRHGDGGYRISGSDEGQTSSQAIVGGYNIGMAMDGYGARRLMEDYMDRSLQTARIMKDRWKEDPAAAQAADNQAKEMLEAYLEAYGENNAF